jgi:uncharacterized membrane protein
VNRVFKYVADKLQELKMIFLLVWIVFVTWAIVVASKRQLSGGAMAGTIIMAVLIPIVGVILAYTLPGGKAQAQDFFQGSSMEELEKAQKLLEKGAISEEEYQKLKSRLLK